MLRKALESREDVSISTDSLIELAECVLKNNIIKHNLSFFKHLRVKAIKTKMDPPYVITVMWVLEKRILQDCSFKPIVS